MQAALDVCLHTQVPGLVSWTKASLLLAIDDTIDSLMKRIGRNGSDIKDITRLSVIFSTAKSTVYPGEYRGRDDGGINCVLIACREAGRQEDISIEENANDKVYVIIHTV
jgi:hypothetical protein